MKITEAELEKDKEKKEAIAIYYVCLKIKIKSYHLISLEIVIWVQAEGNSI